MSSIMTQPYSVLKTLKGLCVQELLGHFKLIQLWGTGEYEFETKQP